ncbi:hypothetical protein HYV30_02215 [Candidatus Kaiserbacteria bacterium]|nr:hypothetical protein [Candidatus Kaiserbacteria bacterium]
MSDSEKLTRKRFWYLFSGFIGALFPVATLVWIWATDFRYGLNFFAFMDAAPEMSILAKVMIPLTYPLLEIEGYFGIPAQAAVFAAIVAWMTAGFLVGAFICKIVRSIASAHFAW